MKKEIKTLKELEDFIPAMDVIQRNELKKSIISEGLRDEIIVWEKGSDLIIVDGHNRYRILQELERLDKLRYKVRHFESIDEVKEWMLILQLGRRNLTSYQSSVLRGTLYSLRKLKTKSNRYTKSSSSEKTVEKIAKEYGVSSATISNDLNFVKGINLLNEQLKRNVLNHSIKVKKSDIEKLGKKDTDEIEHLLLDGKINSISQIEKLVRPPSIDEENYIPIDDKKKEFHHHKISFNLDEHEYNLLRRWFEEANYNNIVDLNEVAKSLIINKLYEVKSLKKL